MSMGPTDRQSRILWFSVTALAVGILVGLVGAMALGVGWLANKLSPVLTPLAIAGVLAFILDPVVDFFEPRVKSRLKAIWLVFTLAVFLVAGLVATVLPRLVSEMRSFTSQVPTYAGKVKSQLDGFLLNPPPWLPTSLLTPLPPPMAATNAAPIDPGHGEPTLEAPHPTAAPAEIAPTFKLSTDITGGLLNWSAKLLPAIGTWVLDQVSRAASVAGLLAGLALVPVYLFYFLLEKRGITGRWHEFLPIRESSTKDEVVFVLGSINDCLVVFFRGQVLVAFCVGTLLAIAFSLLGLNYALLLGVVAGILGIIPYLGVALSLIPAVLIAAAQFGDWGHPLAVLGIFAGVQMMEGLVISPKIIGDRVGLHPLTIIVSVMVGTTLLGGILGGVLAIPLTAALRSLMFRYIWRSAQPARI